MPRYCKVAWEIGFVIPVFIFHFAFEKVGSSLCFLVLVLPNLPTEMCAGSLASGCKLSGHLVSNCCDFRSVCGHFRCPNLVFDRPGASILAPWEPFLHLGGALGSHGSSRKDTLGSRI